MLIKNIKKTMQIAPYAPKDQALTRPARRLWSGPPSQETVELRSAMQGRSIR
jgi:hypothetical protein